MLIDAFSFQVEEWETRYKRRWLWPPRRDRTWARPKQEQAQREELEVGPSQN